MTQIPASPRQATRRRQRRRRRIAVLVCAAAAAAAGATAVILLGAVHSAAVRRAPPPRPVARVRRHLRAPRTHLPSLAARETAAVAAFAQRGLPLYCGGPRGRYVALTFDDGPGGYTRLALRILRRASARATFFDVGRNLAWWPGFLDREGDLGAVGDHTWTHPYLPGLPVSALRWQLASTQQAIERRALAPVVLFRPPYGARDPAVDAVARGLRMVEVLWNVDSFDWKGADWRQIAANVLGRLRTGSIVLMHENRGQTVRSLRFALLPALRARHWRLVSVPELLVLDPPTRLQLRKGLAGCGGIGASRRLSSGS